MAIYSAVPPPPETPPNETTTVLQASTSSTIDIEAWTVQALQSLSISPIARGTGTPLAIPLDDNVAKIQETRQISISVKTRTTPIQRPPSARDSQRRREILQKGKEGSRQRRRWENDRLIGVPNAQPPLPADWEPHPTHPVQHVPYHVAQYWDKGVRRRTEERITALQTARKKQQRKVGSATGLGIGEVPRDLREAAKRRPAVRGWVRVLEEPVRQFLTEQRRKDLDTSEEEVDSEDEEIVFVGRNAGKERAHWTKAHREIGDQSIDKGMVFDSLGDDDTAAFRRWLTHSISDYYGLESRSVTVGEPARRVVYVGIKPAGKNSGPPVWNELPRPLWEVC